MSASFCFNNKPFGYSPLKWTLRQRILSLLILLTLIACFIHQTRASADCEAHDDGTEFCSILIHESGTSFVYHYEIRRALAGAPTVILLPGGPGQGAIGDIATMAKVRFIPENYGVIAIDPRGVGVNDFGPDNLGTLYSTHKVAEDVVQVIAREKLQNYLLYGESYGTVVATQLAHQLTSGLDETNSLEKPKAIVLNRVIGTAFRDQIAGYNQELKRLLSDYSVTERKRIQAALEKLQRESYGSRPTAFSAALMQALVFNIEAQEAGPLAQIPSVRRFLQILAVSGNPSEDPVFKMLSRSFREDSKSLAVETVGPTQHSMAEVIKCTELSDIGDNALVMFDVASLELRLKNSDCQSKGYKLSRPYKAQDYPSRGIPIVYLQGDIDPATPYAQAIEHFHSQATAQKVLIEMKGFSHFSLLGLWKCQEGLWDAFSKGSQSTANHIHRCGDSQLQVHEQTLLTQR